MKSNIFFIILLSFTTPHLFCMNMFDYFVSSRNDTKIKKAINKGDLATIQKFLNKNALYDPFRASHKLEVYKALSVIKEDEAIIRMNNRNFFLIKYGVVSAGSIGVGTYFFNCCKELRDTPIDVTKHLVEYIRKPSFENRMDLSMHAVCATAKYGFSAIVLFSAGCAYYNGKEFYKTLFAEKKFKKHIAIKEFLQNQA